MKNIYLLLIIIISIGCKQSVSNRSGSFYDLICAPDEMPEFDGNKVTILDANRNPVKDTIMNQIVKRRDVFKPCRKLIYGAIWKDKNGNVITNSRIKMVALGQRWDVQPEIQDEIVVQFEFNEEDIKKTEKYQLNKGILDRRWMGQGREGVIENVEEIWMHPFRSNQYNFTEVAPFPEVKFPMKVGKSWSGSLSIQDGWGDWENTSGNFNYEVVAKEKIKTPYGVIQNCWRINSEAKYDFGNSYFEYWFNEDLGFVKMEYKNYGNQTLSFILEEVNDKSL